MITQEISYMPRDLEQRLEDLAMRSGKPKSFFIAEALRKCMDEFEIHYLAPCDKYSLEYVRSMPAEDLQAMLEIWR